MPFGVWPSAHFAKQMNHRKITTSHSTNKGMDPFHNSPMQKNLK